MLNKDSQIILAHEMLSHGVPLPQAIGFKHERLPLTWMMRVMSVFNHEDDEYRDKVIKESGVDIFTGYTWEGLTEQLYEMQQEKK